MNAANSRKQQADRLAVDRVTSAQRDYGRPGVDLQGRKVHTGHPARDAMRQTDD